MYEVGTPPPNNPDKPNGLVASNNNKQHILKVKSVRVKVHECFSMTLDYTKKGEVKIDMRKYVKNMINEFMIRIKK